MDEDRLVIDGALRREIREAILQGFQSLADFGVLVSTALGTTLAKITTDPDLEDAVFEVIFWANRKRRLPALVCTAAWRKPKGKRLQALADRFWRAAEPGQREQVVLKAVPFQQAGPWQLTLTQRMRAVCRIEPQPPEYQRLRDRLLGRTRRRHY